MLKFSSGEDGHPSNWARTCDICHAAACTVYCYTDSAYLCHNCDECIHEANPMVLQHERVWVCSACGNAPAAFTCQADATFVCTSSDIEVHSANQLGSFHHWVPIPPLSGMAFASSTYLEELQGPMQDTKDKIMANKCNEGDEYLDLLENNSSAEYQYQDKNDQQQLLSVHQEENGSDSVVPSPRLLKQRRNSSSSARFTSTESMNPQKLLS